MKIVKTFSLTELINQFELNSINDYELKWQVIEGYYKLHNSLDWNELKSAIDMLVHLRRISIVDDYQGPAKQVIDQIFQQEDVSLVDLELIKIDWKKL